MKSRVEISASRLRANFAAVQRAAGADATILAVVKADGYGHGAAICAPVLRDAGARWLGVTDVDEGIAVRAALAENLHESFTRILVMCGSLPEDAPALVAHELTPVVWTPAHLEAMEAAAMAADRRVRVHVEVDTGMSRQGVAETEIAALLQKLAQSPWLVCEGIMGHLCCAEVAGSAKTAEAEEAFQRAISFPTFETCAPEYVHLENTSAVDEGSVATSLPRAELSSNSERIVRTGLALYGYTLPVVGNVHRPPLLHDTMQPVMTWKAPVLGVREIAAGTSVGYGATFTASKPMRLALLPVGYADGFRREASSGLGFGWVMLRGQRAPVVGRVSMNLTVVDVTGIADVAVGEDAVLLGEGVTAADHARWAGTIPYDILCSVRGRRGLAA